MQLTILAVGRMKAGPERELYDRYCDRAAKAGRSLHLQGPSLTEITEARHDNPEVRKNLEAESLINAIGDAGRIVMLDESGKDIDSRGFADLVQLQQQEGIKNLAFAIGGPDGHGDAIRQAAFRRIRFGSVTWPHQIVRILLAEQIYRAMTILSGHPYHRS